MRAKHKPRRDNSMNEKQEAQWLYAKGLELAFLIKGAVRPTNEITEEWQLNRYINNNYHEIAMMLTRQIADSATKMIKQGLM